MARRAPAAAALIAGLLALALAATTAFGAGPNASLPDIEDEVMCVQCGTALNVSTSPIAERERELIRRLIERGLTKQQIKDRLVAEFGPGVLATPQDRGFGLAAYLVPPVVVLLALLVLLTTARRWRRANERREPNQPLGPADERRLERDMAGYDL